MQSVGHKLLSGSSLRVANFAAHVVVAFFLSPFIIHTLGDRLYGFWTLIATFIGYYGLLDFGLSTAVGRHMAGALGSKDDEEIKRLYNTALPIFTGIGFVALLITIVIVLISPLLLTDPTEIPVFRIVILILGFNMVIDFLSRVFIGSLHAQMNFHIVSIIGIAALFVRSSLIVLALNAGYQLIALALISFCTGAAAKFLLYYYAKKKLPSLIINKNHFNFATAHKLFSYSFYMMISQVANQLRFHADAFVIASFLNLSLVTHYGIAGTLITYFNQLIGTIMSVFNPLFSQQEAGQTPLKMQTTLYFATRISVGTSSFIGFGMIAWGSPFIERWMGVDYLDAYPCLVVLVIGMLSFLWQLPAHSFLYATSKHKILAILNLIEGIANLCLSLVLVRHYGIFGVALGTFFTLIISKMIAFPVFFARVTPFVYFEYMRNLLFYVIICSMSLIIPYFITVFFISADYTNLLLVAILSAVSYAISSWLILLVKQDRKYFKDSLFSILRRVA